MNCWQTLGIAPTGDEAAIKTAYAARIRQHRPDRDPAGFRRIRAAYEEALRLRHHYESHRDEPRRPTGWTPSNPPVAADDSDENSISQHDPCQPYPLAESTAHNYRDTPPAAPEQPYPLSEPAAHDYQDGSAHPILTPLEATVLLRQLQQAWQGLDDAALLAILQAQATHPALDNIDFRLDYTGALTACLDDGDYPHSRLWVQQHYGLQDPDSPLLTILGLIAAPLLALVLIYSHYPPLFNRKTAKGLVVADTAVMALGICVLSYIILRQEMSRPVAALSSLLTAGIFIHFNPPRPETIPRSLLAALFRLFTLIGLYSAAVFALIFLMGRIIDAGYGLLPALILLALYTLHITATFIHSNRQQHA